MTGIILTSIAVLALLALGIYALTIQRTAANLVLFSVLALLAGLEIFDQFSLQLSGDGATFKNISLFLEALLPGAFLALSFVYGRIKPFEDLPKVRVVLAAGLALFPLVMLIVNGTNLSYSPDFQVDRVLFLGDEGYWFYIGTMAAFILSLMNVEATLTATHGIALNRVKFEAIGIMSMLAVLIFYYSQGLLYRTINMNLVAIRSSVFIVASLLIFYSLAFREGGARISVSRHVLYRSITLLAVGLYLIGLGLVGEGMRYFGLSFARELTIFLAFVGGMLLLAVLLSEKIRRRTQVYISKNFFVNKHDYREEWINLTNRFSSCTTLDDVQESILTVYRQTFGLGGASLYLLSKDEKRYVRVAEQVMKASPAELSVSDELRSYFVGRERVLSLTDGEHPLSGSEQADFKQAGTWLAVPLISRNRLEGFALLREQIVPEKLTYDDYDLMKVLARQAAQAITNLKLSEELMEMRAMAAVSRISTFVIHDLKNLTTGLSLVLDNAQEHIANPDFQRDMIKTIKNTLAKMKGLMQRLRAIPEKLTLQAKVKDLDRLSRETVEELAKMGKGGRITYSGVSVFSSVDKEEIKKVIINMVRNALDATSDSDTVMVTTGEEQGRACIRVSDSGCGMTEDYVKNHLFRPFRTTKEAGLGIGLYQCKQIVEAHDGSIEVQSEVDKGTVFTICLPVVKER